MAAGELVQADLAVGRLERQPGQHDLEQGRVEAGERLDREVVGEQEPAQVGRTAGGHVGEPVPDLGAEAIPDRAQRVVLVQALSGRGRPQPVGADHAPQEERPVGQQAAGILGEQHALQVHAVLALPRRADRLGQHIGGTAQPGHRDVEVDDVERREAQGLLAVPEQGGPAQAEA